MNPKQFTRSTTRWLARGMGLAALSYAGYAVVTWFHYGRTKPPTGNAADALLDQFMPQYEVSDRHETPVAAPAEITLSAAEEMDLGSCALIRGIFKSREWVLRSKPDAEFRPRGILAQTKSLGWGMLAERPGREIVMGCATKPWEANPVFRALPPDEFVAFHEPGYVKIIWSLRADPSGNGESIFRTETRAIATDPEARTKFRRYWSLLSPGIIMIRTVMLPTVKSDAERRWREIAA